MDKESTEYLVVQEYYKVAKESSKISNLTEIAQYSTGEIGFTFILTYLNTFTRVFYSKEHVDICIEVPNFNSELDIRLITYEEFSNYVDTDLERMKKVWGS